MRILCALPLAIVCLVGCGGPSIQGKWNMTGAGAPPGGTVVMEFTGNTFKQTVDASQGAMSMHAEATGTYTITDKKIKMTITDIKMDDSKLPEAAKAMVKAAVEKEKGKSQEGELKIEGDTATITTDKGAMNLTRVK